MPPQGSQSNNPSSNIPPPPSGYVLAPPKGYVMNPPAGYAMDDPKGNYDFGDLGKVSGLMVNGKPASRQDALHFLAGQHVMAQAVADKAQEKQQGSVNLQKAFSDEQVLKDFMSDLATVGVLGGASKLAKMGRWAAPVSDAELFQNFAKEAAEKPQPGIGPGTAHVTDPGFSTGQMGAHADYLNNLPDAAPGKSITGSHVADYNNYKLAPASSAEEARSRNIISPMMEKYQTDPDFRNLADAARMYVHNYHEIGDIDKISLGLDPVHATWNHATPEDLSLRDLWDVDPDTRMFDGKPFGKGTISYDEGKQMAETLSSAIREAKERDIPLWRGITPYKGVDQLAKGDLFDLPLSSFSDRPSIAGGFGNNFVFELTGPSKHLNIKPFNSMMEGEHLTQGRFEVTGTGTKTIEHPPFHEGGKSVFETVRYVTIHQIGAY